MKASCTIFITMIPFFACMLGYYVTARFCQGPLSTMPQLIGLCPAQTIALLSRYRLRPQLINSVQNKDIADGTVIQQYPRPGITIREGQTVLLILSCLPESTLAPPLLGKTLQEIESAAHKKGIAISTIFFPSNKHDGRCIAQDPSPSTVVANDKMVVYIARQQEQLVLWPSFIGKDLDVVLEFLRASGVEPHITTDNPHSTNRIVLQQQPHAGSFVSLDKTPLLYVQIRI
jgi:beta-lactam-binding protein with PASTA domain